jgi:hypothetical protein
VKRLLPLLLIFTIACSSDKISPEKKTAHLFVDILIAEEAYKTMPDSLKVRVDSLYNYYGTDSLNYLQTLESFKYDKETWDNFFKYAEEYLDTLKAHEINFSRNVEYETSK